jgi:DNA-binding IclR family transcriptional regulator
MKAIDIKASRASDLLKEMVEHGIIDRCPDTERASIDSDSIRVEAMGFYRVNSKLLPL